MSLAKKIGLIVAVLCIIVVQPSHEDCPTGVGTPGGKAVPDVLSLVKGQNGFAATVEIITPEDDSIIVTETYNGAKKYGLVEVNDLSRGRTFTTYYYAATNEKFDVEDDGCVTTDFGTEDKYDVINSWISPESAQNEIDLFGNLEYSGPTVLMVYAQSVSSKAQYVGTDKVDGRNLDHWFHCLNGNVYLDWWFDSSTGLPVRFALNSTNEGSDPHVYNYLIFEPLVTTVNDIISYPIGYGCVRYKSTKSPQPNFPAFAKSDAFSLDMEAMIMYTNPDKVLLSSNRMMKYQNTFSYEISDEPNTTRIIQNPNHEGMYAVNTETGECQIVDESYVSWPYHIDLGFNLMQPILSYASWWSNYMGQISTDAGLMDVWEDDLYDFFSTRKNTIDASVTFYFPAIDRTKNPNQAPAKIIIKPHNKRYISASKTLPYQIEIIIIDYTEDEFELTDRYDVSGCYDGPGEFTWFQIVMSDPSAGSYSKALGNIKTYFEETLNTFIPVIRIPEITVNLYEFNFYITVKLLERPPFRFYYQPASGFVIENPTSILIRDHVEDCGEICIQNNKCYDFSYCSDFTCQIFVSTNDISLASLKENPNCTEYYRIDFDIPDSMIERNILASSKSILSQIKTKIESGEFVISKYSLSAEDLFIVSGPEAIGGIEDEYNEEDETLKGDEYTVISPDNRLINGETITGVSYSDCMQLCQNDDDCYTISYCYNYHDECVLSNQTKTDITESLTAQTSYADGCDVFEKSFMAFYRKFPGQSLVLDAVTTLTDLDESECARKCYQSTEFPCKSFDFCTQSADKKTGSKAQVACFLHEFHVVEDTAHEITNNVWDFSTSSCDHYAVQLSRDYTHYIGRQFKAGSVTILDEIEDVGLERCASDCNSAEGGCVTFEYCESIANEQGANVKTTCRLSSTSANAVNFDSLESTNKVCSVYYNKAKAAQLSSAASADHFGVAMGLGAFFFVVAFAVGIAGSIFYQKRRA